MENLGQIPDTHRHNPIVKASFAFDKAIAYCLITLGKRLKQIETLLGKSSSETKEIYTQYTNERFENIKNPLDSIR